LLKPKTKIKPGGCGCISISLGLVVFLLLCMIGGGFIGFPDLTYSSSTHMSKSEKKEKYRKYRRAKISKQTNHNLPTPKK
jgi:hypothetical protein